jgi:hypothetical protein
LRRQQPQISVSQTVQLGALREHLIEARYIAVEHQIEIAFNGS